MSDTMFELFVASPLRSLVILAVAGVIAWRWRSKTWVVIVALPFLILNSIVVGIYGFMFFVMGGFWLLTTYPGLFIILGLLGLLFGGGTYYIIIVKKA